MRKTSWYRLALVGAVAIVLFNTWLAAHSLHTLVNAQFWQAHTLDVISQSEGLFAEVRTAESAARGYVLTGEPSFEQQYIESDLAIRHRIERVQRLTGDNPSQQVRLAHLRNRIAAKMSALQASIAVRRGHPAGALDPEMLGAVVQDTPDRMESVQYGIREIEEEESRLLANRVVEAASAQREVWITFTLAFVLDFLLLIAAFEQLLRGERTRERLVQSAKEIGALNAELTSLNTELESRVEQRTRELAVSNQELEAFSYSVSHDLRAPLRTIDGFSLALQEDFADKLNDEGRDYITRVRNGVQRMGSLIDALLQLSRVTRSDVHREQVDLSLLATLVFRELQAADPGREVTWISRPGIMADCDPRLMRVAFENLLGNAWKFTARTPNATIEFGSSPEEGHTVYFIRDNGAGFDMQYVDRLFTAFQRLHGEREFKGSGIGLATVSRIIRRHHGKIWAEGEIDHGATFFFTLAA
ncbi:MAG TPA: CHASE3 domain-containing protein [Acidobacteriaceae bacterium]|jgi:signal transduction histidine kinase|nr:CHASE3 domain-containing protein [Acidobacteriaceae bacterium]